jgi:hypothetical protein
LNTGIVSPIVTIAGAALTTLLGVLVGAVLSNRSQRRQWSRDRKADACAQVLRESSNMLIELADMLIKMVGSDHQRAIPTAGQLDVPTSLDWKPWNEALAMISLVADHDIVDAALAIDAEFWPVHLKIKRGLAGEEDWRDLRDPIEAKRKDFVNVARQHLAPPGPLLRRLTARPAAGDPIWKPSRPHLDEREAGTSLRPG